MNTKLILTGSLSLAVAISLCGAILQPASVAAYKCTGETNGAPHVYQDGACYDADGNSADDRPVHNDGTSIRNWACATGTYEAATHSCKGSTSTPTPVGADTTPNEDGTPAGGTEDEKSRTEGVGGAGECAGVKTDFLACDGDGVDAIIGILRIVVIIVSVGVGVVAVGGIVYGALLYTSAQDNQDQVRRAIKIVRSVVVGLILYSFMVAILNWLVPGSVISTSDEQEGAESSQTEQREQSEGDEPATNMP